MFGPGCRVGGSDQRSGWTSSSRPVVTQYTKPRMWSLCRTKRRQVQPLHGLLDAGVGISECLDRPVRCHSDLFYQLCPKVVLVDLLETAVGVVHEHDLAGLEVPLGKAQRPDHVVGDDPARVTDDVCLAMAPGQAVDTCSSVSPCRPPQPRGASVRPGVWRRGTPQRTPDWRPRTRRRWGCARSRSAGHGSVGHSQRVTGLGRCKCSSVGAQLICLAMPSQ